MKHDPARVAGLELSNGAAVVESGIVADHMDHSVTAEPPSQVVQVSDEQFGVPTSRRDPTAAAGRSASAATRQMPFLVIAWRDDLGLFAADHPARTDLGVQVHVDFVLKDDRFLGGQMGDQPLDVPQFRRVLGIARADNWPRSRTDELHAVHPAANSFRTQTNVLSLMQQQSQQLAGPATAKEAEVLRSEGSEPTHHHDQPRGHRHGSLLRAKHASHAAGAKSRFTVAINVGLANAALPIAGRNASRPTAAAPEHGVPRPTGTSSNRPCVPSPKVEYCHPWLGLRICGHKHPQTYGQAISFSRAPLALRPQRGAI